MSLKRWRESMSEEQFQGLRLALYKYCLSLTRSAQDAEDLAQETWLKVAAQEKRYGKHANPEALLLRVAKNTWIDSLRRSLLFGKVLQREQERQKIAGSSQEQSTRQRLEAAFYVMMQDLSPMQRTVLLMREVFGYSALECAEYLNTTEGAVKALLYRARQALIPARMRGIDFYEEQIIVEDDSKLPDLSLFVEAYEQGDMERLIDMAGWSVKDKHAASNTGLQDYAQPISKPAALPSMNTTPQMAMSLAA
ncbi:RNA polymerase sigma factor [Paenibacillus senegalensis]|uniref:RNA polymerase sigma factor n=1 Tax=Paenibacillus senegalensis TaxID=1465766 RepID=UPI00028836B0|nr:RNA polymerase sigma factor [Paenibacillus senegalensis]